MATGKLTDFQRKALQALHETPGLSAADFAERMWPGSNMHTKVSNTGHGACRGKAAWLAGGSYLGKLRKAGYVRRDRRYGFVLTGEGEKALKGE